MINLSGMFDIGTIRQITEYTTVRFKNSNKFLAPEALTLSEQRYMGQAEIKRLCEEVYECELFEPLQTFVPFEIKEACADTNILPISYNPMNRTITCVTLKELDAIPPVIFGVTVVVMFTTPNFFFANYQRLYGRSKELSDIPPKDLIETIISEGVNLGAADITISTTGRAASVYYNVRKKKVRSNRIFTADTMLDIITFLCSKSPYDTSSGKPKYADKDFSKETRGRIVINRKHGGYVITIRLLENKAFNNTLEQLNLTPKAIDFLRNKFMDDETGLRLIVGPTMSGKNMTALALLQEVAVQDKWKIVSVEIPVETELPGVEQIHCENPEEYKSNIETLIHQNPDFAYITEIRDSTGLATVHMTNTGKRVLSSLHSNGVADTIPRLMDITGLPSDRIIQTLHSIVYQELVRDEEQDKVFPRERYLRLTREVKSLLYGKSLGDIIKIIEEREDGDDDIKH